MKVGSKTENFLSQQAKQKETMRRLNTDSCKVPHKSHYTSETLPSRMAMSDLTHSRSS